MVETKKLVFKPSEVSGAACIELTEQLDIL
jgi:hypothetical protein